MITESVLKAELLSLFPEEWADFPKDIEQVLATLQEFDVTSVCSLRELVNKHYDFAIRDIQALNYTGKPNRITILDRVLGYEFGAEYDFYYKYKR